MEELVPPPPACFRCPISLEVMQDPVSLCSGVSYERSNIQRWLQEHNTCPSTSQQLSSRDLIPNHTLRRLITQWLAVNTALVPGKPSSKFNPDARFEQVERLVERLVSPRAEQPIHLLRQLRLMAKESARSSRVIGESEDAVPVLASILASRRMDWSCREESLATLVLIPLSAMKRRLLASNKSFISGVCSVLRKGSGVEPRMNAATLLEAMVGTDRDLKIAVGSDQDGFTGLVELLRCCSSSQMAVRASLRTLMALCSPRRNRIKAVEAGVAEALVEILPEIRDTSTCENALAVLEMICRCAEGRAAVCEIQGGIGVISSKILAVSDVGTEYTVRTLWAICKHCSDEGGVQRRIVEAGVVAKLLLMLQMDFSSATKHNLRDLLKLLSNIHQHCPDVVLQDRIQLGS